MWEVTTGNEEIFKVRTVPIPGKERKSSRLGIAWIMIRHVRC